MYGKVIKVHDTPLEATYNSFKYLNKDVTLPLALFKSFEEIYETFYFLPLFKKQPLIAHGIN